MIVFYKKRESGKITIHKYSGAVTFLENGRVVLFDKEKTAPPRVTIFDDSSTPPGLIKENIELKYLKENGAELPDCYIDRRGNIRNSNGELVFEGPNFVDRNMLFFYEDDMKVDIKLEDLLKEEKKTEAYKNLE